jgi:hypothetical protein
MGTRLTPRVAIYADTLSQWSVLSPLLDQVKGRASIALLAGESVAAKARSQFPSIDVHATFLEPAETEPRGPYIKRALSRDVHYRRYQIFRSLFEDRIAWHKAWLLNVKPDVLIIGEDGISGEIWLIRAAKELKIRVIILPYEASGKEDFINLLGQKQHEGSLLMLDDRQQRYLRRLGGEDWFTEYEGTAASIHNVEYIAALLDLRFRFSNPWTTHGGEADMIASESIGMTRHYLAEGLPPKKIKYVGSPYDDRIQSHIFGRDDLHAAYRNGTKITPGTTKILVSLPPNYDDSRLHLSPFRSYVEMCRFLQQAFAQHPNAKVTVVVHPAYLSQTPVLSDHPNLRLSSDWVIDLIPQHDVTCGSSTLRWASAAKKVAINLDLYKFRLKFFNKLPGLKNFEDPKDCLSFVAELTGEDTRFNDYIAANMSQAHEWAMFDGQCRKRIADLLGS